MEIIIFFPQNKNIILYIMLSEVFWVAFITTISGMILKLASLAYKSKCKECSVGCIKVIRDVEAETKELEFKVNNKVKEEEEKTPLV
jgi:aldehyde:ferredoxin oxidoreductase